jgi:hypothetical protein
MKLGTHMPGGERRNPIDIKDRRTKLGYEVELGLQYDERCPVVNFFVSTQYRKNEMSVLNETWYTHAW